MNFLVSFKWCFDADNKPNSKRKNFNKVSIKTGLILYAPQQPSPE